MASDTPLSTESSNNANQTVLSGRDLDALPDDPDEMAAALQALAGPTIGPSGGQIFIDGFSSGNMPPKESIREIRINQNPFAAENDQPSGRIDILTKPGTDKFRGNLNLNFNDESLNSRNPFSINSSKRTPYQVRQFGGNFSGPLKAKKASFFFEANRNETDDNDLCPVRPEVSKGWSSQREGFDTSARTGSVSSDLRFDATCIVRRLPDLGEPSGRRGLTLIEEGGRVRR